MHISKNEMKIKKEDYDTPVLHTKLVFFVELIQVIHLDVELKSVFQHWFCKVRIL